MLLRASRASELLTKEAIVGWTARTALRGTAGLGKRLWKHKKGLGIGAAVTGFPAMEAAGNIRRGNIGMNPQWTAARMRGQVGRVPGM